MNKFGIKTGWSIQQELRLLSGDISIYEQAYLDSTAHLLYEEKRRKKKKKKVAVGHRPELDA